MLGRNCLLPNRPGLQRSQARTWREDELGQAWLKVPVRQPVRAAPQPCPSLAVLKAQHWTPLAPLPCLPLPTFL